MSLVDYILIFGAVAFVLVVITKVMSVTMTFVRLTVKRIRSGPSRNKEVEVDDFAGDFARKINQPELVTDSEIRNFVTDTSERYQFLSDYHLGQQNGSSEFSHTIKTKLPKNKKATDDMFNYILWNYISKNKKVIDDLMVSYKLNLQEPKALLTEYDIPEYQDESFIEEEKNIVSYTNYRRVERQLCGALLKDIREQEGQPDFEVVVKLSFVDVLGLRQVETKSYTYEYISEMIETMPFAQDLVLDLSHRYEDILSLNEHYLTQNITDKQVYKNYRRDVNNARPYRDQSIVTGITMPYRKFREIEQKLCKDLLLKP